MKERYPDELDELIAKSGRHEISDKEFFRRAAELERRKKDGEEGSGEDGAEDGGKGGWKPFAGIGVNVKL